MQPRTINNFEPESGESSPRDDEAALEQAGLPTLAATAPDLICTYDFEGRLLSVNRAACEALGFSEAALRGMTIPQLLPGGTVDFAGHMQDLMRDGFATGMMKLITMSGERRIWECRSTLETDEARQIVRGVARDVTEREVAFRAVRRSEEQFRSLIENASDLIGIVELDGRITYQSPSVERALGYPPDALARMPCADLVHPEDLGRVKDFLASTIAELASAQSIEVRARHQDGSWRSFEIVANGLVKRGQTSAIVVNARDITERRLLEAQLAQAKRLGALGRLAATVAHEFNNVLMGIQPFAELLQRADATPAMVSKGAWHILNSVQRGKRIVLDILRFTQPHEPVTTAVDLGEWWETFAPEAEGVLGNTISIVSTIPRRGFYVLADRTQLSQVFGNLVVNARDAMAAGGTLAVEASNPGADATFPFGVVTHPDRFLHMSIRDTGHGMTADVMDHIFEPLYTTRQSGGTGLGLAVAHQIVTQHGGFIFVESEPGLGSTFHVFLPKASPARAKAFAMRPSRAPTARRLLIIDDEVGIAEGLATLLEHDGIEVEAIVSGAEAERAMVRFQPDVVLLDHGLPGMDGSEVYALIRELDPSLPVIFATGHGDRRVIYDGLDDPCTRFLQKPFEVADLLEMMADLETEARDE